MIHIHWKKKTFGYCELFSARIYYHFGEIIEFDKLKIEFVEVMTQNLIGNSKYVVCNDFFLLVL